MNLPTSAIILGTLVVATTAIAYIGDTVGKRVGKRRVSLFGLRPRHTGVLISVLTGVLILATAVLAMSISSERVRIALFGMEKLRKEERRLRGESRRLSTEARNLLKQRDALEKKVAERGAEVAKLERQVKGLQTHLGSTESSLKKSDSRLKVQNMAVAEARAMLGDVRGLLAAEKHRLKQIGERLEEKRRELAETSKQLAEASEQLFNASENAFKVGAETLKLEGEVLALQQEKSRLEQDVKQLEEFARPLFEIAKRAREGEVIYEANQVIGSAVIDSERAVAAIRQQLADLLDEGTREALEKGARPDKEGGRAVQLATKRTGTAETPVYYHEGEILDLISKDIHQSGGSVVVELWALRNYVAGEQIGADFVLFPNRPCFRAGDTLVSRRLDPAGEADSAALKAGLFRDILAALQEVRKVARAKGMRPDESGQFGEVSYEQIFALLDRVQAGKRALTFRIVAAADAWTAGPVRIRFEVEGLDSP
jgi:uncharacterized protein (DUF3084 family)